MTREDTTDVNISDMKRVTPDPERGSSRKKASEDGPDETEERSRQFLEATRVIPWEADARTCISCPPHAGHPSFSQGYIATLLSCVHLSGPIPDCNPACDERFKKSHVDHDPGEIVLRHHFRGECPPYR